MVEVDEFEENSSSGDGSPTPKSQSEQMSPAPKKRMHIRPPGVVLSADSSPNVETFMQKDMGEVEDGSSSSESSRLPPGPDSPPKTVSKAKSRTGKAPAKSRTGKAPAKKIFNFDELRSMDGGDPTIEDIFMEVKRVFPNILKPIKHKSAGVVYKVFDNIKGAHPEVKDDELRFKYKTLKNGYWKTLTIDDVVEVEPKGGGHPIHCFTFNKAINFLALLPHTELGKAVSKASSRCISLHTAGDLEHAKTAVKNAMDESRSSLRVGLGDGGAGESGDNTGDHSDIDSTQVGQKRNTDYSASGKAPVGDNTKKKKKLKVSKEDVLNTLLSFLVEKKAIPKYKRNKVFCENLRPDFLWNLEHTVVILECDEHQHKGYGKYAEAAREIQLMTGCGEKNLVLVRYNPDTLKTPNTSESGEGVLAKEPREKTIARIVVEIIQKCMHTSPEDKFTRHMLFYDCGCSDVDFCGFRHVSSWKSRDEYVAMHFGGILGGKGCGCERDEARIEKLQTRILELEREQEIRAKELKLDDVGAKMKIGEEAREELEIKAKTTELDHALDLKRIESEERVKMKELDINKELEMKRMELQYDMETKLELARLEKATPTMEKKTQST
jgi:hypothetical protein